MLTAPNREWLAALPEVPVIVDDVVEICHGSPFDEDAYIFDELDAVRALKVSTRPLCLFGHTHYPMTFELSADSFDSVGSAAAEEAKVEMRDGCKYLINPGSVGQPRDGDPRAAYAIVDTVERRVELYRTRYRVDEAQSKILGIARTRLREPEVTLVLREYEKPYVTVAGYVTTPGKVELKGPMTIVEALALAGGFRPDGKQSQLILFRRTNAEEYEIFKKHPGFGRDILDPIKFLHPLIPGVHLHHERWDGRGYPLGLKGKDVPMMARIIAVADTYDAMTSDRAYRRALQGCRRTLHRYAKDGPDFLHMAQLLDAERARLAKDETRV